MSVFTVNNISIKAMAACVPKNTEHNKDYDLLTEAERDLLIKTTGIESRRVAPESLCTSDMCLESANAIIEKLKINRNEIDVLVFVSQTLDYFLPATGIILQNRLGLPKSTMAFDLVLGCSGYVYGLSVISSLLSSGRMKKGLLLVGDKSTFSITKSDKSTYPLFGDAGTATYLEYDENASPLHFNLQSDGEGFDAIIIPDGGTRNRENEKSLVPVEYEKGIVRSRRNLWLDGLKVFNFSLREVAPNVKALLDFNNETVDDYDYYVFHQANKLMNESIRKKLKIPAEKFPYTLGKYGNTSSASVPLTIVSELAGKSNTKMNLLLSAFGVGLSWGSVSITNAEFEIIPLIETN